MSDVFLNREDAKKVNEILESKYDWINVIDEATIFCANCGKIINSNVNYCSNCGTKIDRDVNLNGIDELMDAINTVLMGK